MEGAMLTDQERKVVREAAALIVRETGDGEKVMVKGFGTFAIKEKAARTARNPKTGEAVDVPARAVLSFKASPGTIEYK